MVSTILTRAVTREKLARVFKDHELIKLIESLAQDVSGAIPDDLSAIERTADEALSSAVLAIGAAREAHGAADRLAQLMGQMNAMLLTDRNEHAAVEALRQRFEQLEATVRAMRSPDIASLQKQIDELKTLIIGR